MSLSAADKKWIRKAVREEFTKCVGELVEGLTAQQLGGYDGATMMLEEMDLDGQKSKSIGFATNRPVSGNDT